MLKCLKHGRGWLRLLITFGLYMQIGVISRGFPLNGSIWRRMKCTCLIQFPLCAEIEFQVPQVPPVGLYSLKINYCFVFYKNTIKVVISLTETFVPENILKFLFKKKENKTRPLWLAHECWWWIFRRQRRKCIQKESHSTSPVVPLPPRWNTKPPNIFQIFFFSK